MNTLTNPQLTDGATFDILVLGGGSAGCAAAEGLSRDGRHTVCLIESGGTNDLFRVKTPGMMPFLPKAANWKFETVPQIGLNGRRGYQPRGHGLGGSSAINAMLYIRGHKWDYDHWADQENGAGCRGWSHADVLPIFRAMEDNARGADEFHGAGGPLSVSDQHWANRGSNAFVAAAARLQLPINDDFNGAVQDGFGLYQTTMRGGERWSASRAFIEPNRERANLNVQTGALIERLTIANGRVTGAVVRVNGQSMTIHARAGVVLSAGAFGSPHILMVSGIGPAAHLAERGVAVVSDRAEVGANLRDHIDYVASFQTESKDFIGDSLAGTLAMGKALIQYVRRREGMMTTPWAEAGGFWRSSPDLPAPDVQYHFVPAMLEDHGRTKVKGHGFSCHACVLRPESKGTVRLANADPAAAPLIDPAFLTAEADRRTLRAGVRQMYRIFATPPLSDYHPIDRHPVDLDDDDALDAAIAARADTVYHPVGTCRMGNDHAAVVDPTLKANGVDGLWVADASIMPSLIGGNTNAPSIMIGMRAAEFVKRALR
jgi:choline dehydrogenase-like flavoprotein